MLGKNLQVFNIHYAVTPGHRADVTERIIRTPVVNHDDHVGGVNDSVSIKVNNGDD